MRFAIGLASVGPHSPRLCKRSIYQCAGTRLVSTALSVTVKPFPNFAEQTPPQAIPEGDDVTVPIPVPALVTSSDQPGPHCYAIRSQSAGAGQPWAALHPATQLCAAQS